MTLDVLLSAMHLKDYHYIETLNISGNCVIINQCDHENKTYISNTAQKITYIETLERGLSKSRNMAIANSCSDVCILCDNDVEYYENYEQLILKEYEAHPDCDIIIFHVATELKPVPYYKKSKYLNFITCLKATSYEISFRRERIKDIPFDEHVGAGTHFSHGEENSFLYHCLKKGLKMYYVPITIAKLRYEPSTWKSGFNEHFFISRGASYYSMSPLGSYLLILQFALRKYKLYRNQQTFIHSLYLMLQGRKQYKKEVIK